MGLIMPDLFSTTAQISFTGVGLILVILTTNDETRKFWFGDSGSHKSNVYLSLIFLVISGIISLGALVPPINIYTLNLPFWPFAAFLGAILVCMIKNNKLHPKEREEFVRLENDYVKITVQQRYYLGYLLFLTSFCF